MELAIIYPRFTGPYGGERLVLNLAKNLQKQDVEVSIYTQKLSKSIMVKTNSLKIITGNYPTISNHQLSTFLDFILMPILAFKLRNNFNIVMPIGWQSVFCSYIYKKFVNSNAKIIYYCLEPPRFIYDLKQETLNNVGFLKKIILSILIYIVRKIDLIAISSVDEIISISNWTANQVQKIYKKKSKIIEPGVEIERFNKITKTESRKILNIPLKKTIFLSVSKLHPRKRINIAIDVYLDKKNDNSVFYIIGTGPDKDKIEKIIYNKKLKNILLLGELNDEKVDLYMKASDYFIFTAINEPFGIAPLEAQVAGCKVIPNKPQYNPQKWNQVAIKLIDFINSNLII